MASVGPDRDALLGRWRELGARDRQEIMAALPAEHRLQLRALLNDAPEPESSADRQYFAYSGWLGALIEASAKDDPRSAGPEASLKANVRSALRAAHEIAVTEDRTTSRSGLLVHWRKVVSDWLADL